MSAAPLLLVTRRSHRLIECITVASGEQSEYIFFHLLCKLYWCLETGDGESFRILYFLNVVQERLQPGVAFICIYMLFINEAIFVVFAGVLIFLNSVAAVAKPEQANVE